MDSYNFDSRANKLDKKLDNAIKDINNFLEGIYENMIRIAGRALEVEIELNKARRTIKYMKEKDLRVQALIERLENEIKNLNERVYKNELAIENQSRYRVRNVGFNRGRGYNLTHRGQYLNRNQVRQNNRGGLYQRRTNQYSRDAFEESRAHTEQENEKPEPTANHNSKPKTIKNYSDELTNSQESDSNSNDDNSKKNQAKTSNNKQRIIKFKDRNSSSKTDFHLKKIHKSKK